MNGVKISKGRPHLKWGWESGRRRAHAVPLKVNYRRDCQLQTTTERSHQQEDIQLQTPTERSQQERIANYRKKMYTASQTESNSAMRKNYHPELLVFSTGVSFQTTPPSLFLFYL